MAEDIPFSTLPVQNETISKGQLEYLNKGNIKCQITLNHSIKESLSIRAAWMSLKKFGKLNESFNMNDAEK